MISIPVLTNDGLNSRICEHFGHTPFFAFVSIEKGEISLISVDENPFEHHGPGDIPQFLKEKGASVIISRGMGQRAKDFFDQLGIEVVTGASGTVQELTEAYIQKTLQSRDYTPSDHGEHHHH